MRCLAFDPGRNVGNFAFSWLVNGVVECYGTVVPIVSLQDPEFSIDADDFSARLRVLIKSLGVTAENIVIAERFSDRGGGSKGTTGEFINIQIGLLKAAIAPLPLRLIMPAQWKGWLARTYHTGNPTPRQRTVVPNMLAHLRGRFPETYEDKQDRMTIHEADAIAISLWSYEVQAQDRIGSIDNLIDRHTIRVVI